MSSEGFEVEVRVVGIQLLKECMGIKGADGKALGVAPTPVHELTSEHAFLTIKYDKVQSEFHPL